jgi:riboflavin kinase/FMN adenylyltransferase
MESPTTWRRGGESETAMQVLDGWRKLPATARGAAVALGNFDGVHLGHQSVIGDAAEAAARLGVPLGVISFEPHARMYFQPGAPPFRLMSPHQLASTVADLGAKRLYMLPFDAEMAGFTDLDFVRDVLVTGLDVRHVAVGFDVTFGKGRTGDPQSMRRYGDTFGFSVSVAAPMTLNGAKISSSAIREAVRDGRPEVAARLMGHSFAIQGVVQAGRQLGRTIGIPTANVSLGGYVTPRLGVYATRTRLADGRVIDGVANVGVNPTTGEVAPRLEVWLFDFQEDIYGMMIETELLAFIRPEEKFSSVDEMVRQIHLDADIARAHLASGPD